MSKKLSMGIAIAMMTAIPQSSISVGNTCDPYQRKEHWKGNGKRRKPKAR